MSGCGYQGYEFGARYLDSMCVDGQLYDADSDFEPLDYLPCPGCEPLAAMNNYADDWLESLDCRWPRYRAWHLVMDIRRNRGMLTLPLLAWLAYRAWRELTCFDGDWWFRLRRWVW